MRAIKIDVENQTISEIDIDGSLASLYKEIGCNLIEITRLISLGPHNDLILDEEGFLVYEPKIFTIKGGTQPFAGNAVILGINNRTGKHVKTELELDYIKTIVKFL